MTVFCRIAQLIPWWYFVWLLQQLLRLRQSFVFLDPTQRHGFLRALSIMAMSLLRAVT